MGSIETPLEQAPEVLRQQARGQFPLIESKLAEQGLEFPSTWEVQHVLTASALAVSHISNDMIPDSSQKADFSTITIQLVDDSYYHHKVINNQTNLDYDGRPTAFGFSVISGRNEFSGSVFSPNNENNYSPNSFGTPSHVMVYHDGQQIGQPGVSTLYSYHLLKFDQLELTRPIGFTQKGLEFVDFIGGLIRADGLRS